MDSYIFRVAISTRETLSMIGDKVMGRCFGPMGHFIRESGRMVLRMGRDRFICREMR